MSMKPGATIRPVASNSSMPPVSRFGPMAAMRPSSIKTSQVESRLLAGSITRPFLMARRGIGSVLENALQHGHAHRDAVAHLVQDHRALGIGYIRRDFAAA